MSVKQPSKRKKQMIDVSLSILHEEGLLSLTTRNIAKRLDIAEASLYKHIKAKDDLFRDIFLMIESFYTDVLGIYKNAELSPLAALEQAFLRWNEHMGADRRVAYIHLNSAVFFKDISELDKQMYELRKTEQTNIVSLVKAAQDKSLIRKDLTSDFISTQLSGMLMVNVTKWVQDEKAGDLNTLAQASWKSFLVMLQAK